MFTLPYENHLNNYWKLPLITDYIRKWSALTPENTALISADSGVSYTYKQFEEMITLYALRFKQLGIKKGDVVVTQWLASPEFFILTYACAMTGVIMTPLDIRQQPHEVVRDMNKIDPVAFFSLGDTSTKNFSEVTEHVKEQVPSVKYFFQLTQNTESNNVLEYCYNFNNLFDRNELLKLTEDLKLVNQLHSDYYNLNKRDSHIIIFTSGTTGEPKPALICHENTMINNAVFSREVGFYGATNRYLNSMPTSHVAGTCQGPMTIWFTGGTVITISAFTPKGVLSAIQEYRPVWTGGVPTQFRMMWSQPDYNEYDLSSLRFVLYGGSAVDTPFLEKMAEMAPTFGTSLGMTECAGYFTATPKATPIHEMVGQVGQVFPDLAPVTIREPMNEDGTAGEELQLGEAGEICVHGPIVFLGYYNDKEATSKMISREGILYTGDMGYFENFGLYYGLKFAGRRKFVIKPKGYLVFPDEVSDFIAGHPKVSQAQVVGVKHEIYDDGVFAFVQPKDDVSLTPKEIHEYCKGIAAYKRPLHVEIWSPEKSFPQNRVGKIHIPGLKEIAEEIVNKLRKKGEWDAR